MYGINYSQDDFLVWVDKGGTGKTNFCLGIKHIFEANFTKCVIITNQSASILGKILKNDELVFLDKTKHLGHINSLKIFDLEGHAKDAFVIDAIKNCKKFIVPLVPEFSELQAAVYSIFNIKNFNPNAKIGVLVNKVKNDKKFNDVEFHLRKIEGLTIFRLPETRAMPNMLEQGKSIESMMNESPLLKRSFANTYNEFLKIYNFLKNG